MSYHSAAEMSRRTNHKPFATKSSRVLYLASTPVSHLARLVLLSVATTALSGKPFAASQRRLGEMFNRDERSVRRAIRLLKQKGLIRVKRRGCKISNLMYLSCWLWEKLTGQKVSGRVKRAEQLNLGLMPKDPTKARSWFNDYLKGGEGNAGDSICSTV